MNSRSQDGPFSFIPPGESDPVQIAAKTMNYCVNQARQYDVERSGSEFHPSLDDLLELGYRFVKVKIVLYNSEPAR